MPTGTIRNGARMTSTAFPAVRCAWFTQGGRWCVDLSSWRQRSLSVYETFTMRCLELTFSRRMKWWQLKRVAKLSSRTLCLSKRPAAWVGAGFPGLPSWV